MIDKMKSILKLIEDKRLSIGEGHFDLHKETAALLFETPVENVSPEQRKYAKNLLYIYTYSN